MENERRELFEKIVNEWADKGKILEGGWQAFVALYFPPAAPEIQKTEMRKAYFLGAQHLFASILTMLEPGTDATEADLKRMDLIEQELERFNDSLEGEK